MGGYSITSKEITTSSSIPKDLGKSPYHTRPRTADVDPAQHLPTSGLGLEAEMIYPAVMHKEPDSDYGVSFPDLPGCVSAGTTVEEALLGAKEAAECHLEGLLIDGDEVPLPGTVEDYRGKEDYAGGTWALVQIDMSALSVKAKRLNITLPERLVHVVDQYAKRHGETRSGLLAHAVTEYMAKHP
jgi:predicted RNase H-like HicB family nuclease